MPGGSVCYDRIGRQCKRVAASTALEIVWLSSTPHAPRAVTTSLSYPEVSPASQLHSARARVHSRHSGNLFDSQMQFAKRAHTASLCVNWRDCSTSHRVIVSRLAQFDARHYWFPCLQRQPRGSQLPLPIGGDGEHVVRVAVFLSLIHSYS